jgi:glutathione S-transferase
MRARLALVASCTVCELREVNLSAKPEGLLAASAKGTVPVLLLPDGRVIDESLEIMRWSLRQCDPGGWLALDDPDLITMNDGPFKHNLDRYKYPERYGSDAVAHRSGGLECLRELDARLADKGQLCGPMPGLADMAIMPFVRQFAAIDRAWFDTQPLPDLHAWLKGHLSSDTFAAIMVRFRRWKVGDHPTLFAGPRRADIQL